MCCFRRVAELEKAQLGTFFTRKDGAESGEHLPLRHAHFTQLQHARGKLPLFNPAHADNTHFSANLGRYEDRVIATIFIELARRSSVVGSASQEQWVRLNRTENWF